MDVSIIEKDLKNNSRNSTEDFLKYILFEMKAPIEDYFLVIDLLKEEYSKKEDIRIAILVSYLSSTWLGFQENEFLIYLDKHLVEADDQNKAIIYYLMAYDIYIRCDTKYPSEYSTYLRESVAHSKRFVNNYIRLSEVTNRKEARKLLDQAISNVENIWDEEKLTDISADSIPTYDDFINEFILGVDISKSEYEMLITKRRNY